MSSTHPSIAGRLRQARRLLVSEGASGMSRRVRNRLATALAPPGAQSLRVSREDFVLAAEVARRGWRTPPPLPWSSGEPMRIAWVSVPAGPGSGGHTTMFRMIAALEEAGHECVLYLLDQHGWEIEQHRQTIRSWWPWVHADVRDLADGIEDCHAIFATNWESAYPVLASPARGARLYLVQDFEPMFHPAGSLSLLAEATYRFGFHGVTAGRWLTQRLQKDYAMEADYFEFGCDLDVYRIDRSPAAAERRTGVACYSRPSTPRRSHELAMAALDLFAARHPEVDIHLFGEPAGALPFRATHHGVATPQQLSSLYNDCIAGLVLSATNVSLVPHEMLAAGCIPVVNDAEQNRVVLDNPHVVYSSPTPFELADALSALVTRPRAECLATAEAAAASTGSHSWETAGARVEDIVRRVVETQPARDAASRLTGSPAPSTDSNST